MTANVDDTEAELRRLRSQRRQDLLDRRVAELLLDERHARLEHRTLDLLHDYLYPAA